MTTSSTLTSAELKNSLDIVEVKPGLRFTRDALITLLPDVTTALFFGKVYDLDVAQLSNVLSSVLNTALADALFTGDHSTDLQDYVLDLDYEEWIGSDANEGAVTFGADVPKGEILPELWASLEIEVADSIKQVASKLQQVVNAMPGKHGQMVFKSLMALNKKRPTIGDYRAKVHHPPALDNLVILDVSGSMTAATIRTIVDDVVAMSYEANAHLAIVSNTCTYWEPGSYSSSDVLSAAEFGGTYYETLLPLFDRDWGVVVTVADYDSSYDAKRVLAGAVGRIDTVLDISLVNRPTFLAECVGQLASTVRPLLVATTHNVLNA